ncbi:MAG: hypothetical protein JW751_28835 [Polyangiaceae bacterium]|nr:hypothetical protein [Polyangiaceae bacterium]
MAAEPQRTTLKDVPGTGHARVVPQDLGGLVMWQALVYFSQEFNIQQHFVRPTFADPLRRRSIWPARGSSLPRPAATTQPHGDAAAREDLPAIPGAQRASARDSTVPAEAPSPPPSIARSPQGEAADAQPRSGEHRRVLWPMGNAVLVSSVARQHVPSSELRKDVQEMWRRWLRRRVRTP